MEDEHVLASRLKAGNFGTILIPGGSQVEGDRYRWLCDQVPAGIFQTDAAGRCIYTNRHLQEMTGLSLEETLGDGWLQAIHPEDREKIFLEWKKRARRGRTISLEFRIITSEEQVCWIHTRARAVKSETGAPMGYVGMNEDITERKRAEEALREAGTELERRVQERTEKLARANEILLEEIQDRSRIEADLRKSEERFKVVGRATNDAVWDWDLETNELWWSEGFHQILGCSPEEIQADVDSWYRCVHPEDCERVVHGIHQAIESGQRVWSAEYRFCRKDGSYAFIIDRGFVMHDARGKPMRMIGAMMDITQRRRAEEEIKQLNADLEKRVAERTRQLEMANRELESFSYSVSHDLRAPLRAIQGFSKILLDEYRSQFPAEAVPYLDLIEGSGRRMGHLIDDLLALSKLGRHELRFSEINMRDLVEKVVVELLPAPVTRQIEFKLSRLPPCRADETLIRQVWINLLSNAIKFTGSREKAIIEVGSCHEAENEVYFVRDNGAGFDMAHAGRLFGVFQRLHSAEEFEGTGVGLAIVQRLVHRMGGRVWAESQLNEGAVFYFALPGLDGK